MPLRNAGLVLAAYDYAVGKDHKFSFTVWADLLKLLGPSDDFEKQSAHTSQSLQASLPVIPPLLRLWSRINVNVWHKNRGPALNSRSICLSARCCCLPEGGRWQRDNYQTCPRGYVTHWAKACLFDACDKRSDPWPLSSRWVTGSELRDGASRAHHAAVIGQHSKVVTKQFSVCFWVVYTTICGWQRPLHDDRTDVK